MTYIKLSNACVEFTIFNHSGRSLKKSLISAATGGYIGSDEDGRVKVKALDDITLLINPGDRVALVGHNGAGKSTLLRLLATVYTPTAGKAVISGKISSLIDITLGIDPEATGRENIYIRGALLGMNRRQLESEIEQIISFTDLGDFIDMPLRTYSSGMLLRLGFAISTSQVPNILLMDEWLSVGDDDFRKKSEERMQRLVAETDILVVATHSKELALDICNRAIWLEHGRVIMDDTVVNVCSKYFGNA